MMLIISKNITLHGYEISDSKSSHFLIIQNQTLIFKPSVHTDFTQKGILQENLLKNINQRE